MKTNRIMTGLVAAMLLASCGKGDDKASQAEAKKAPTGITLERAMIGAPKGAKAEVIRMQKVAGNWRSMPGVFGNKQEYLLLVLSNDARFTLEVRGRSPDDKLDSVNVQVRGAIAWDQEGHLKGNGAGAKPPIAAFGVWTAQFPTAETMTIRGTDGKEYGLSYKGL